MTDIGTLLIRADASEEIGTGHVMRMIALAQAWRRRGGKTQFLSCKCPDGICKRIKEAGFDQEMIAASPGSTLDLNALLDRLGEHNSTVVVLDNYHFDSHYQSKVREAARKLLVVDDYAHLERYDADIVLNHNPHGSELGLADKIGDAALLSGTTFALIREEFLKIKKNADPSCNSAVNSLKVLVTLGGSDPVNCTTRVVEALKRYSAEIDSIKVVIGAAYASEAALKKVAAHHPCEIEILRNARYMPELMEWADFAVAAGGSTCWEFSLLNVPVALLIVANNQRQIVDELTSRGAAISLGWHESATVDSISAGLAPLLDPNARIELSRKIGYMVDGRGADRVAATLDGQLRITIATSEGGWLLNHLEPFIEHLVKSGHHVTKVNKAEDIPCGDILLLLSFWSIVSPDLLSKHTHNLVVHESALPHGRGWSPVTWQVTEGKNTIPTSLIEATHEVDAGNIYLTKEMQLSGTELIEEIRHEQSRITFDLCKEFIETYPQMAARSKEQKGTPTYYTRRVPKDSRIDPNLSLKDQFNLLRVVDNDNYPAYFELNGKRYVLRISESTHQPD